MKQSNLERVKAAQAEAFKRLGESEARMRQNTGPVVPGDILLWPNLPEDCPLSFGVVRAHPDNDGSQEDAFLLVPLDDADIFVGLCDVYEDNDYLGHLVARCGYGLWVRTHELPPFTEEGRAKLGRKMHERIKKKFSQIARGKLEGTSSQWENEANPDYEEWCGRVDCWVMGLKERLEVGLLYFSDANSPGTIYLGTEAHMNALQAKHGGYPTPWLNPITAPVGQKQVVKIKDGSDELWDVVRAPDHWLE